MIKRRWWWSIQEKDPSKANFVWTEWFNAPVVKNLAETDYKRVFQIDNRHEDYTKESSS